MKTKTTLQRIIHSTWLVYALGLTVILLQLRHLL